MKMIGRILWLCLVVLLITGCGKEREKQDGKSGEVLIGLVTDIGGRADKSFNESAIRGLEEWAWGKLYVSGRYEDLTPDKIQDSLPPEIKELPFKITPLNIKAKVIESKSNQEYETNMKMLIKEGAKMIIAVGYMLTEATKKMALEYPNIKFFLIDSVLTDEDGNEIVLPNVRTYVFPEHEGSFLVGAIAGLVTKTNVIGFVGGIEGQLIKKFEAGFVAGVKTTNPKAEVIAKYTGKFDDSGAGKSVAEILIGRNADVIYHASGACGIGVIEACRLFKDRKVYAIGVDSDQSHLAPEHVLTSMIKHVDLSVYLAIKSFVEDKNFSGNYILSLKEAGVAYAPILNSIPDRDNVIKKTETLRQMIIDGKIKVPKTMEELKNFVPPENF